MKISKLTSYAKINLDLKIKYYDKIIKKHKISSKVVLLKLNDLINAVYYKQHKKPTTTVVLLFGVGGC